MKSKIEPMMNRRVRELILISLLAAFCGGLAFAHDRQLFAAAFATYRAFFYQALMLFALNFRLSSVLGRLVIRHRRQTEHRLTLVGEEYVHPDKARARQDRHILHAASGLDVRGEEELPHYLLMRCVTAMKQGKGRASLGSALTGCYSTLLESAEGRRLQKCFRDMPASKAYFDMLFRMVRPSDDPKPVRMFLTAILRGP